MKKILVALDCSVPSMRAARYAAEIASFLPACHVTLFTVLTGVPHGAKALAEVVSSETTELHGDDDHQQELHEAQNILAEASALFTECGFGSEQLTTLAKPLRRGIAQDILDEAQAHECDTIVVGRRGLSKMQQVVLGSVSRDLIQKGEGIAVWVID
ncbi:MAG: hypothetical protein PWP34_1657 [Desulfuromonadales bacterium]|nr:hypothetical protein [Desulfuromonadales bacterium]